MGDKIKKFVAVLFVAGLSLVIPGISWADVRVWEGSVTFPTYGWEDDVNPKFWALEGEVKFATTVKGSIVYPYTMQDHLSRTKENRTYKALFLENEYLKITCLPELGGRLHSVFDKTEGEEMFHFNKVIKPGMIAMRGAWISGGVEWNAGPQGHTVTILSPVDAIIGKNPDGSAYIEVSNLEKSLRTQWTVRVTLHSGKSYLDERICIFNPIDAVNPYYFWNCTAFPNKPGTRFIYPMTLGTDHTGTQFFPWPINEGKDLSWLKNYETWASIFAVNCSYDFFGAYEVDADRGIVQVANHYELGGKKAWTWGTWDFGLVSQKNLTDDDGPYIEVQSGPLPTQSDYGMLLPREDVSWQEWWYPVHKLGDGFEYATKDLAVQTNRSNGELQLHIIATGKFPDAICTISEEHQEVLKKRLDLSPQSPVVLTVSAAPKSPVDITIKTKNGVVLASFVNPLPIPLVTPPEPLSFVKKADDQLTVEEKFLKGQKSDLATDRKNARQYYEKAIAEDAGYLPALRALAVLDIEAGLYDNAAQQLDKALNRNPSDGLSWYFLGVSHLNRKNETGGLRCAYQAARCFGTASLGYDLAGRSFMRLKEYSKAADAFEKSVRLNPRDTKAKNHLLLALYAAGENKLVYKYSKLRISQNPTDLVPRALAALESKKEMNRFVLESRAFVGEDEFEMLETSLVFADVGLVNEAAKILQSACVEAIPQGERSPLPLYYMAYFSSLKDDKASAMAYLKEAAATYKDYVFPSRPEEVEILRYATKENPSDAYAHLYIGNLYANLERLDEAASHWQKASGLNPSLSIAFRNLGLYAWAIENNLTKAEDLYAKAIAARPKDQTLYRDLADIFLVDNKRPKAIEVLQSAPFEKVRRADVTIMLAQAYLDEQKFTETINLLESTPYFVNWEGQTIVWDIFNKAHLRRGQQRFESKDFQGALEDFTAALTYPENIGVGRSNKPREAPAQYWRGKSLEAIGKSDEARSAWKKGAASPESSEEQNKYRQLCIELLKTN